MSANNVLFNKWWLNKNSVCALGCKIDKFKEHKEQPRPRGLQGKYGGLVNLKIKLSVASQIRVESFWTSILLGLGV